MNTSVIPTSQPAEVLRVLRGRRTVHAFHPELPPFALIRDAIEAARWAPNHHLTEPWHFHHLGPASIAAVVTLNTELVQAKSGKDAAEIKRQQWSAVPGWLAVTCIRNPDARRETEDYAACCCAVQNFMLALWSHGIGAKWTTGKVTQHEQFFRIVGIDPAARRVVALLWYGYPKAIPEQQRKPVDEILSLLP